jgi:chemotaxis protein CheX
MEEVSFPRIEVLEDLLIRAVANVFTTMLQKDIAFKRRYSRHEMGETPFYALGTKDPLVVGSIGFVGEANGVVYIYMHQKIASEIASIMTGMGVDELSSEFDIVKDVIGEIANMAIGNFKNHICDLGFNCRVTLPTVLRGSQMEVDSLQSAKRETFQFEFLKQPIVMDLFIQEGGA